MKLILRKVFLHQVSRSGGMYVDFFLIESPYKNDFTIGDISRLTLQGGDAELVEDFSQAADIIFNPVQTGATLAEARVNAGACRRPHCKVGDLSLLPCPINTGLTPRSFSSTQKQFRNVFPICRVAFQKLYNIPT